MGYVFVDQSASLLSKVAFANSYATLAMSQKLKSDIQTIAGAMNLTDEQKESLSTLPIGSAVVRLADEHPEPFLVRIPRFPIREGSVSDDAIRSRMAGCSAMSAADIAQQAKPEAVSVVPPPDRKEKIKGLKENTHKKSHPPSPEESQMTLHDVSADSELDPPRETTDISREEIRFLADLSARPLSTTVSRYQRLNLSRRRGNAIRQSLQSAGVIKAVPIATRSGQVVLYQLTDFGRSMCSRTGIDPGPLSRESPEHRYWVMKASEHFEKKGYEITREHPIKGNGAVDLLAERPGERVVVEVETGKSDIKANLKKIKGVVFNRVVLLATSPAAVSTRQNAIHSTESIDPSEVELLTWLDIS